MALVWIAVMVVGFGVAVVASRRAIHHGSALASATRIPPFIVGITLFAVGTDLPEIANSIVASASGHGDINVGDSVGSAATQSTLILGILPLAGGAFVVGRRRITGIALATVVALLGGAWLMADGRLSRIDALLLVAGWLAGSLILFRHPPPGSEAVMAVPVRHPIHNAVAAVIALGAVGVGASLAVLAFVRLAELLSVSEYIITFIVASLGTSLPELVVTVIALRAGACDLAIGDITGASFVDSTLSIGIGPLFVPTAVTASLAVRGSLATAGAIITVVALLAFTRRNDRRTGLVLIAIYGAVFATVLM